jgi:hypothetical protein
MTGRLTLCRARKSRSVKTDEGDNYLDEHRRTAGRIFCCMAGFGGGRNDLRERSYGVRPQVF